MEMILNERLATQEEMNTAWMYVNSAEGKATIMRGSSDKNLAKFFAEIQDLLMTFGGFTSLPITMDEAEEETSQATVSPEKNTRTTDPKEQGRRKPWKGRSNGRRNGPPAQGPQVPMKMPMNSSSASHTPILPNEARPGPSKHQHKRRPTASPLSPVSMPDSTLTDGQVNFSTASSRPPFSNDHVRGRGRGRGRGTWSRGRGRGPVPSGLA